ncbi:AAA family ATPase [Porphyrobacter sp. ULC335]|uniref:AAA family ATPase n=1 Tax=Porphyrobacter sp. ULC335 TaxID=2854260 RepID=UPI00221ED1A1|nr:AAA family ATPase [Porphyrobacter sp. ULC335]UYV15960.1 AAA family ATPase [Porphyrobacter sp. ULC335]
MRLRSVWISQYKNLRDFTIGFDGDGFIDIFVGKNGSGKSNFLEALIEIFDHIFAFDPDAEGPGFDYAVRFEIAGAETSIVWREGQLNINDDAGRRTLGATPLPDNVLVYYSGQNDNVTALVGRYEERYRGQLRRAAATMTPRFVGIGPACKKLLIVVLLLLPEANLARQYLCAKLGILGNRRTVRIALKRPHFAAAGDHDPFEEAQRFWGAQGPVRGFLDQLLGCIEGEFTPGSIYDREADKYVLDCNLDALREGMGEDASEMLFRSFDALRIVGMLDDIGIAITLESLEVSELNHFSDGQFQSVYVFAVSEIFKRRNCLTLLDEPDAFLHPEWQFDFLDQVTAISAEAASTNHILLSSHSASTVAAKCDNRIRLFSSGAGVVTIEQPDKSNIVRSLSAGLITFSEIEASLSIEHILLNTDGPILFTEGVSDTLVLTTAWERLFPGVQRRFAIESAFGCAYLRKMLQEQDFFAQHSARKIFGLFDFDTAYNEWKNLGELIEVDPSKCLVRKRAVGDWFAILLPVYPALSIRNQVLRAGTDENFAHKSKLDMELMFYDAFGIGQHFELDPAEPYECIRFIGNKTRFAKEFVPNLDVQYFEPFRPIFDFITSKIEAA